MRLHAWKHIPTESKCYLEKPLEYIYYSSLQSEEAILSTSNQVSLKL